MGKDGPVADSFDGWLFHASSQANGSSVESCIYVYGEPPQEVVFLRVNHDGDYLHAFIDHLPRLKGYAHAGNLPVDSA